MAELDTNALRDVLRRLQDPATGTDLVAAGRVEDLQARDGLVQVTLSTNREHAGAMSQIAQQAEALLRAQPGIRNVTMVVTAHREQAPAAARPHAHGPHGGGGADRPLLLPQVGAIIAVASGKGGVGKSTTAVNLAVALAKQNLRVGLLDADVHGPSLPRMLGLQRKPAVRGDRIIPLDAWGLKAMSIGFMVDEATAMVWRGPMVMGALEQMMGQVEWGDLDVLVVDMPPGTGDAQLTLSQRVKLAGAVIVSTPQDIALLDARRGVSMFEKVGVPVLGMVENMSFFCCPACGHRAELFGHGGARQEAAKLGVPFLAEIPLLLEIRTSADAGTPIVAADPDSLAAHAYAELARRVAEQLPATVRR